MRLLIARTEQVAAEVRAFEGQAYLTSALGNPANMEISLSRYRISVKEPPEREPRTPEPIEDLPPTRPDAPEPIEDPPPDSSSPRGPVREPLWDGPATAPRALRSAATAGGAISVRGTMG
jgi:hypothetical protein